MNLKQAYKGWQQQTQNATLYRNTRDAFRLTWATLPMDKPCSYYTKDILGHALAEPHVIESWKAQAASVMWHVLTFAHWAEPKFNPEPDFTFDALMAYNRPGGGSGEDGNLLPDAAEAPCAGISLAEADDMDNSKTETDMEKEKRQTGRPPRQVCQIDPETLQVVRTFASCTEGCEASGVKRIDHAIKHLYKAGGYYWQYPEDVPTFAERLAALDRKPSPAPKEERRRNDAPQKPSAGDAVGTAASEETAAVPPDAAQRSAARDALRVFTDKELIDELIRRGWKGDLQLTVTVSL